MERRFARLCVAVVILVGASPACAQLEVVTIERPFRAQSLSGVVVDPNGKPIAGVSVEARDPTFKSVLFATITDADGHFAFPAPKNGTVHYLHMESKGFDPMQMTVVLRSLARRGVRIRLNVAS